MEFKRRAYPATRRYRDRRTRGGSTRIRAVLPEVRSWRQGDPHLTRLAIRIPSRIGVTVASNSGSAPTRRLNSSVP